MKPKVKDVMTRPVVVVGTDAPYKEIVRLLHDHRVTAVPVIEPEGHVVGVVSEADLLVKEELGPEAHASPLAVGRRRMDASKAAARTAGELMTAPAVTIGQEEPIAAAARLMHRRSVKRLPVVDEEGRLLGIVSRTDLLRVYLRPDEEIRREIVDHVLDVDVLSVAVTVLDGVVTVAGQFELASTIPLARELIEAVDGVVGVDMRAGSRVDDSKRRPAATPWAVFAPGVGPRP
jgi:CBS domain-containing protein